MSTCAYSPDGQQYGIGTELGEVHLFKSQQNNVCRMFSHDHGVSAFCWTSSNEFTVGDRLGSLTHYDVRSRQASEQVDGFHRDRVVGMTLSTDGQLLATGGNGHRVNIWDVRKRSQPLFVFRQHGSAVRAMDFCPWMPHVLVTGGGRDDGQLCFYNTLTGRLLKTIETIDQGGCFNLVCQVRWSKHYKELFTAHAREKDQLTLWDMSRLDQTREIISLSGHLSRPMHVCSSPDGQTIATMGGDEVIKFWKCFETSSAKPTKKPLFSSTIR